MNFGLVDSKLVLEHISRDEWVYQCLLLGHAYLPFGSSVPSFPIFLFLLTLRGALDALETCCLL